jgi:hypothetical protein
MTKRDRRAAIQMLSLQLQDSVPVEAADEGCTLEMWMTEPAEWRRETWRRFIEKRFGYVAALTGASKEELDYSNLPDESMVKLSERVAALRAMQARSNGASHVVH